MVIYITLELIQLLSKTNQDKVVHDFCERNYVPLSRKAATADDN